MPSTDYVSSSDWHRIGPELSVRFSGTPEQIQVEWSPRWPSDYETALVSAHLRTLREQFVRHAHARGCGAPTATDQVVLDGSSWQSLAVVGGLLMLETDGGARVATPQDLHKVVEMLPDLLLAQEAEAATWRKRRPSKGASR